MEHGCTEKTEPYGGVSTYLLLRRNEGSTVVTIFHVPDMPSAAFQSGDGALALSTSSCVIAPWPL
jgi:hypothetical protein